MRYRVKPLKSCPEVGIVKVPLGHAGDGSARVHVAFVEEVDVPGIGAGGQRAVLGVGRGPAEGDDIAGLEQSIPSEEWWQRRRPVDCRR